MGKVLEMVNVSKAFPGVVALDNVCFDLEEGEVHALVGENGAGKSTLMKILFGVYRKDSGTIKVRGRTVEFRGSQDSYHLGIRLIPQELSLVPTLSVMENIFVGQLPSKTLGVVDWAHMRQRAGDALRELGLTMVDLGTRVSELTVSEQQMVAIARAFQSSPSILVFDEPTSALGREETRNLFAIIRRLKAKGIGIVYISHRLEELSEIADRVTVMRDGKVVRTVPAREATIQWLVDAMTGMSESERYPRVEHRIEERVLLEVRKLSRGRRVRDVSFKVRAGEILGMTGFVGAGKTEIARMLFGVDPPDSGEILLEDRRLVLRSPKDAIRAGIALVPEDRRTEGLVTPRRVCENLTLPCINDFIARAGFLDFGKERRVTDQSISSLSIATPSGSQRVKYLSGGNQQKIVVGKWVNAKAKVFIFDEATRGIDVRSKAEIYRIMANLAKRGAAVIAISMEFPEVLGISDRVIVMRQGSIADEMPRSEATLERLYLAAGGEHR